MKSILIKSIGTALVLSASVFTNSASAGLIDRGNGMIYDDVLDITWLQDANYAKTSGFRTSGIMLWKDANSWARNLTYGGFDDWRLPKMYDVGGDGCNSSRTGGTDCGYNVLTSYTDRNGYTHFSELAYMFHENLGNSARYDRNGQVNNGAPFFTSFTDSVTGDTVSFENLARSSIYWYGNTYLPRGKQAWVFSMSSGIQWAPSKSSNIQAWAVRDGDVAGSAGPNPAPVPEPASLALFGLGLLGLSLRERRRKLNKH